VAAGRVSLPSREQALSRLDRGSGIRHRPATELTDTLATHDPVALALWQAQRERTLASIRRIRAGLPSPRLAIHDPWALRALVLVMLVAPISPRATSGRCASRRRSTGTACWRRPISGSTPGSPRRSIPASRRSSCRLRTRKAPRLPQTGALRFRRAAR